MSQVLMESLGWALLHSLWQGTLVALMLAAALLTVGRRAAHTRYALACGALVLALALPVASGWRHFHGAGARLGTAASEPLGAAALPVAEAAPARATPAPEPRTWTAAARDAAAQEWIDADMAEDGPAFGLEGTVLSRVGPFLVVAGLLLQRALSLVETHLHWLVLAWAAGVGLSSGRMAAEWMKLRRLTRRAVPAPEAWQERMDALARKLGLRRAVRLLQSYDVDVPSAVGWLSPMVLLPVSTLSGLPARQLEMVLAHELAHIRRHDFAVNLAQVLVETLLFFHPAVRWISHVIRVEREHCCDDVAVAASGNSVSYARALTALETLRVLPGTMSPAMSALGGSLPERVRRLITLPTSRCAPRWAAGASVFTLVSSLAVAAPLTSLVLGQLEDTASEDADAVALVSPVGLRPPPPPPAPSSAIAAPPAPRAPRAPLANVAATPPMMAPGTAPSAPPAPPAPVLPPELDATRGFPASIAAMALTTAHAAMAQLPGVMTAEAARNLGAGSRSDVDSRTQVGAGQQLSVDQLVALKVAGVTPERVRQLVDMGYTPTVSNLVGMGHAGVTPDYAQAMNTRFGRKLEAHELTRLRHLGVTPEYIESLKAAGFPTDDPDALVRARAVGVDEAYVRELKAVGYTQLSLDELAHLRAVGVSPEYIDGLGKQGLSKLSPRELMQLRAVGVSSDWLAGMRAAGIKDLSVKELVRLRSGGVDADFIRRMRGTGSK